MRFSSAPNAKIFCDTAGTTVAHRGVLSNSNNIPRASRTLYANASPETDRSKIEKITEKTRFKNYPFLSDF